MTRLGRAAGMAVTVLVGACASAPATGNASDWTAVDLVGDGVFTPGIEGPAVGPDGTLYVVNFGREGTIGGVRAGPGTAGEATLFVTLPSGSIGNGIRFLADGRMLVADYTKHRILRIAPDGAIETYSELANAHQPNDIAVAPDGLVYASDPDWKNKRGRIWLIDRAGQARILEDDMGTTNGIEVSPDGHRLYVAESAERRIWVYDRAADGSISGKRLFAEFPDHGLDGMRTDADGSLYVTRHGAGMVAVLTRDGELQREVRLKGKLPSNIAFGGADGRSVFVTLQDRGAIETFRSERPGREWRGAQAQ